jgi:hypothetical protein
MFPNVRLLIAALLASVVALSCGFGVFAALGVNRDPLAQLPAGATALQLVADEAAAAPATWGAPFGQGSRLSAPQIGAVAARAPVAAPAGRETAALPNAANPWATGTLKAENTDASPHAAPSASPMPAVQPAPIPATMPVRAAPSPAKPPAPIASLTPSAIPPAPAAVTAAPATPLASSPSAPAQEQKTPSVEPQPVQPAADAIAKAAEEKPAANAVPVSAQPADVTGALPGAAAPEANLPEKKPTQKLTRTPERKAPRKVVRRPIERRVARKRVVRPTAAATNPWAGNGNSAFQEPVFSSAPYANEQPPATSRRGSKKTVTNKTPGNPSAWPNEE